MNKEGIIVSTNSNGGEYDAKLEAFFRKKLNYDKINRKIKRGQKVSNKQKKNQLFYEQDKKQFRLVDKNNVVIITAPRISKENVESILKKNKNLIEENKKNILNTKYELLFEYNDIEKYTELYNNIIEPSIKLNDDYQKEIDLLKKKRDSKEMDYQKTRESIILQLDTYKNDIKNQIGGDVNINKAESMNEYIQKQSELYELNREHYLDSFVIDETSKKIQKIYSPSLKIDVLE